MFDVIKPIAVVSPLSSGAAPFVITQDWIKEAKSSGFRLVLDFEEGSTTVIQVFEDRPTDQINEDLSSPPTSVRGSPPPPSPGLDYMVSKSIAMMERRLENYLSMPSTSAVNTDRRFSPYPSHHHRHGRHQQRQQPHQEPTTTTTTMMTTTPTTSEQSIGGQEHDHIQVDFGIEDEDTVEYIVHRPLIISSDEEDEDS